MIFSIQQLKAKSKQINELIEKGLYEEADIEYKQTEIKIRETKKTLTDIDECDKDFIGEFYASYAYFLFGSLEYELFFEMYIKAQDYGYSCKKRREFLYEAFIKPNLHDFRMVYNKNIENMIARGHILEATEFEELPYWLITTGNKDEYYLYEKNLNLIKGKYKFDLIENNYSIELDFSDRDHELAQLIINDGCCHSIQLYIKEFAQKGKTSYCIENGNKEFLSCFQGGIISEFYLSKLVIFKDQNSFKNYFIKKSNYLPRKIIGSNKEKLKYQKIIEEIHHLRLSKEHRIGDNILLSICIPSYNRGNRAHDNVVHTLQSEFDEEIEVIVSNNGTKNKSSIFYTKISEINDSRLTYFEFNETHLLGINLCKLIELAKGKYTFFTSDEDIIDLNALKVIIKILKMIEKKNVALIKTKTEEQGIVPFIGMAEQGKDALLKFAFTANYLTGVIYKKEIVEKHGLLELIRQNLDKIVFYFYSQLVFELQLCQYGNVLGLDLVLTNEGDPEPLEPVSKEKKEILSYATLEARLEQHKGFFEIIKEMEICKSNFDVFRALYLKLCDKTLFLVCLSIREYFKDTDKRKTIEMLKSAYNESVRYLDEIYRGKKSSNKFKYSEDLDQMNELYKKGKIWINS